MFNLRYSSRFCLLLKNVVIGSFLVIITSSCTAVEPIQALHYTWRAYERTIRWDDVSGAVHYLKEDAVTTSKFPKNIKNLKITGYDVIKKTINEDDMVAHQIVKIRYYNVNDFVEQSFIDKQVWKYDALNNRWFLASKLMKFPIKN